MKILFTSGQPYLPQIYGGLNTNTHEFVQELAHHGHEVSVLARLSYGNVFGARTALEMGLRGQKVAMDRDLGYSVYRARRPWKVAALLPRPDIVVIQDGYLLQTASAIAKAGLPAVAYLHSLEFEKWRWNDAQSVATEFPVKGLFANSDFTAQRFQDRFRARPHVIRPVFRAERYRTESARHDVTFINPVSVKGVDIALGLAERCPDIPFTFVKGWPIPAREYLSFRRRVQRLPNVRLHDRTSNMRDIYRRSRILLVPSQWEAETWGRVVSEAQISGIPVLASDRGGLPEAVGPGGLVVGASAPIDIWVSALRRLWADERFYKEKSQAALDYSCRSALDIDVQVSEFIAKLTRVLEKADCKPKRVPSGQSSSEFQVPSLIGFANEALY